MDEGTRITIEVEAFLRLARLGDAEKCESLLKANEALINSVEAGGFCALHFAAAHGHKNLVSCLLSHKPNKELINYDLNTPLMLAAKCKQPETLELLLDGGCDVNFTNSAGGTALAHACTAGFLDIAKTLVKRGAVISTKPSKLGTPLHWAASGGRVDVMHWLIYELGHPIDCVDEHGGTPLYQSIAAKASEAAQFLLDHGANPNAKCSHDDSEPLHVCAAAGTLDDLKMLLDFGADPLAADKEGDTPLSIAQGMPDKKAYVVELSKAPMDAEKRKAEGLRFKEHGNKVFANGENNKAARFYSRSIALDPKNHVYFSNRSACMFNTTQYKQAMYDAQRCVTLKPDWAKGYFRLASALKMLKQVDQAKQVCDAGLKVDPNNADLISVMKDIVAGK